jgi:hypothetical protein
VFGFHQFDRAGLITRLCIQILFSIALPATSVIAQAAPAKEPPKCSVQGQVIHDPGAQPLKKVNIELRPEDKESGTSYKAISDVEGRFKFEKVTPGNYTLTVERNGYLESGKSRGSHSLMLEAGQEINDVVLRMQPAAIIRGRILDNDGDPVPHVSVFVSKFGAASRGAFVGPADTDDLGEYRIGNLRPGRYLIEAILSSYSSESEARMADGTQETAPYPTYYPAGSDKSQAAPVELRAGDEIPINITLSYGPAYRVKGTIVGLPELTGADVNMIVRPKDGNPWQSNGVGVIVKSDGSFETPKLLPGEYRVMFFKADTSDFHIYQAAQIIEVKDSDVANVRLSSESDAEVRGQIRTDKGEKLNWALVSFSLDSGEQEPEFDLVWPGPSPRGQFKPDGSFDIKKVPPGKYRVVFNADTPAARAYYIKSVTVGGQDVTESGFSISGGIWSLDIVLSSAGATIEGAVVDAKEQPVPDATVVIVPTIEKRNQRDLFKKSTSDQHCHFKVEGVRPGEYTLLALDDLDEDYRDPDVLKPYEDRGQTIRVEKGERKGVLLKVIQTGD